MFNKWIGLLMSACGIPFVVLPFASVLPQAKFAVFVIGFGLVILGMFLTIARLDHSRKR